jgi:hypothetical protein
MASRKRKREQETTWQVHARLCLQKHLISDVLDFVVAYAFSLSFTFSHEWSCASLEQENNASRFMCIQGDELIVADDNGALVRMFHAPNGRFLRQFQIPFAPRGDRFSMIEGLAVDSEHLYFSMRTNRVLVSLQWTALRDVQTTYGSSWAFN